jgi:hypothetical protein
LTKQERSKELATLVVSSLWDTLVFLFCFGRFVGSHKSNAFMGKSVAELSCCKQQLQTVLTLYYPRKIKNISATQMRGFKGSILCHCLVVSLLAMTNLDSRLRGNDERVDCFASQLLFRFMRLGTVVENNRKYSF